MTKISQFFVEMRRHHVFRVTGICIVTAWVILEVADLAFESFGLPTAAMRNVWYALIVLASTANEISRLPQSIDYRYGLNRDVISSIAVLPFENLSADPSDKYLSAGMHDALIKALARVNASMVISRKSTLRLSDKLSIPEIGET